MKACETAGRILDTVLEVKTTLPEMFFEFSHKPLCRSPLSVLVRGCLDVARRADVLCKQGRNGSTLEAAGSTVPGLCSKILLPAFPIAVNLVSERRHLAGVRVLPSAMSQVHVLGFSLAWCYPARWFSVTGESRPSPTTVVLRRATPPTSWSPSSIPAPPVPFRPPFPFPDSLLTRRIS